jgi:microcystin-dependent protein
LIAQQEGIARMTSLSSQNRILVALALSAIWAGYVLSPTSARAQATEALYIDEFGKVGIGKKPTQKLEVDGTVKATALQIDGFSTNALVPVGAILMWSGAANAIPPGWQLCDGTNGTPDLRSRFTVGYDNRTSYPGGNYWDPNYNQMRFTGGNKDITLSVSQMPSHTHTGSTDISGAHSHNSNNYVAKCWCAGQSYAAVTGTGSETAQQITTVGGAHQHSLTTNSTGGGESFDGRPPYLVLAYIMKMQ